MVPASRRGSQPNRMLSDSASLKSSASTKLLSSSRTAATAGRRIRVGLAPDKGTLSTRWHAFHTFST